MAFSLQQVGRTWPLALVVSLTLGLAPFMPEPHLVGKLRWVMGGALGMQAVDWFDLLWHVWPFIWLGTALTARIVRRGTNAAS